MKKIALFTFILILLFTLCVHPVFADGPQLTSEYATRILKNLNPHIISYNVDTHVVIYDNYKPILVTPPGEPSKNGEVSWAYFVEKKGDLRGWMKFPLNKVMKEKAQMVREFKKIHGNNNFNPTSYNPGYFPDSSSVSCTQCPQQHGNWCGPAATQSVLSGWGIIGLRQADLASEEGVTNEGTSPEKIAMTLNDKTGTSFYEVDHFNWNDAQTLWSYVLVDIGYWETHEAFVGEVDTIHLTDWRNKVEDGKTKNRVHYIAIYGYWTPTDSTPPESDWQNANIYYTDSATSLYPKLHKYVIQDFIDRDNDNASYLKANNPYPIIA